MESEQATKNVSRVADGDPPAPVSTPPAGQGEQGAKPSRGTRIASAIQTVTMFLASAFGTYYAIRKLDDTSLPSFFAVLIIVVAMYLSILLHELGHWLAARRGGMTVLRVRVGAVEIRPLRRGLRWRWRWRQKGEVMGSVVAFADPARPKTRALALFMAGGVAANAVSAGLFLLIWLACSFDGAWLMLPMALMGAAFAISNLVPKQGVLPTDGMWLLRLWRGATADFDSPQYRILALSVFGCAADRLPRDDLAALERLPFPAPLIGLAYRLKSCLERGEWERAAGMQAELDAQLASADKAIVAKLPSLIAALRTELAFARAIHARDASLLVEDLLPPRAAWDEPQLWPRCQALRAALAGDRAAYRSCLERSRRHADNSVYRATQASEAEIRRRMAEVFAF